MLRFKALFILLFCGFLSQAQVRIDSNFAFSTNPAKKYSLYIPSSYSGSVPNAMMVGFHPLNTLRWNAQSWCDTLLAFAESNNLLLVCPDGGANGSVIDQIDYDFTTALMDSVRKWYNIDTIRTYAMGFSYGGIATYEYGLNHIEQFNGFIPIGAAVSGSSFVSSIIYKAGGIPYYLVHGSNDLPNTRFYPMLNALNANCAYVNSILMSGVGHTIDFPNRNQILTDAFDWIDSVNLSSKIGSMSLISPISFSIVDIQGFANFEHDFYWEKNSIADSCGVMKYELLIDVQGGNFSSPLLAMPSNNGGMDTLLTLNNYVIDSLLNAFSIPLNGSLTVDWTTRSILPRGNSDTAKSFTITLNRKRLGFTLTAPTNNKVVTLQKGSSTFFDWTDILHYYGVRYTVEFDSLTKDFSTPLVIINSDNNGVNSSNSATNQDLYFQLMFRDGKKIGDTIQVKWHAVAKDSIWIEGSGNERNLTLIRGNVGFELIGPPHKSDILSKKGQNYSFTWDSVRLDNITYTLLFDTIGVNLNDTASVMILSDNSGVNARAHITFEILDSLMNFYQVDYLDTLHAKWTSKATHSNGEEYSMTTFEVNIVRSHPVGIDVNTLKEGISIFPNPASDVLNLSWNLEFQFSKMEILDQLGNIIYTTNIKNGLSSMEIGISDYSDGHYLIRFSGERNSATHKLIIAH